MAIPKLIRYQDNSYVSSEGTLLEDFETFSDWTKMEGSSIEANSINTKEGVLSLKLNSTNNVVTAADKVISWDLSATTNFIIWIYIHDLSTLSEVAIYLSSVSDWSKAFGVLLYDYCFKAGWNRMVIAKEQFITTTGESWSNTMIRIKIRCNSTADNETGVSFDDLRYDYEAEAKCIIVFDGSYDNLYTLAKPIMDGNGQVGVSFTIANYIGNELYMTKAQLTTLQSLGWDISQYSYEGSPHLLELSQVEMEEEINNAYNWLVANGFSEGAKFFAYPHGEYNDAVVAKVRERHRIARCTHHAHFQPHFNMGDTELLVKMRRIDAIYSPATVQGWIDNTIIQNGLMVLMFHRIVESGATGNSYNVADFETISDYLASSGIAAGIDVITLSDYYDQFMPSDLTSVVYLEHGPLVPYQIAHEPSESIGRAEDGRIKVYKHPLAGDRKRIFRIKCIIDDTGSSGYKWRDLEYFYTKVVEGAKRPCVFVDANSIQYLVRIIDFKPKAIGLNNRHEVTMILEEDYA